MTNEEAIKNINALNAVCGQKGLYDSEFENALALAIEALEKQATQKWISVDDRLPEFGVSVLARCFYHGKWRTLVCYRSKENFGEWYTDEVCQWVKVTHWMPLPSDPPKGE